MQYSDSHANIDFRVLIYLTRTHHFYNFAFREETVNKSWECVREGQRWEADA